MTLFTILTHAGAALLGFTLAMLFAALFCRKKLRKKPRKPHDIYETLRDDEPPQMLNYREALPHG